MPTTSSDASTGTASLQGTQGDVLDDVRELLACEDESVAEAAQAFANLVRAVIPDLISQPVQAVDAVFELIQQSLNVQRRLVRDLLTSLQILALKTVWNDTNTTVSSRAKVASTRRRAARNAA